MTPTAAAARTSQTSGPSLRDRLKDPSLLREQCYIDGAWTGTAGQAGDQSGQRRRTGESSVS